jgi:Pyruvate/2-oxoacid:ferredoxin oxidoreductase gamma subunit
VPVHRHFLRPGAVAIVNAARLTGYDAVDADRLATLAGEPRAANLALLGYTAGRGALFAGPERFEETIRAITPAKYLDRNLAAFRAGRDAAP